MALLLRQEILEALASARERVGHGYASLEDAFRLVRVGARKQPMSDAARQRLEDFLRRARADFRQRPIPYELDTLAHKSKGLPWSDPGDLSRAEALLLLNDAKALVDATPARSLGPLFPGLL